jgi:hypothetical protein
MALLALPGGPMAGFIDNVMFLERLAVDPHSELFVRNDGMGQSGPDPISAAPLAPNTGEKRVSNTDGIRHLALSPKV